MELGCGPAILRPFRSTDAESLAEHANSRAVWLNLRDQFPHPYTRSDADQYITAALAHPPQTRFAIVVAESAVGGVSLRLGQDVQRPSAELGYWLGEAFWCRGIVSAAVAAVTEHAFTRLGLVRVFAVPFVRNPPRPVRWKKRGMCARR